MYRRALTLTFRNLKKNLLYTVIVITGLAVGITTFLAIIQWSAWHLSYDHHFSNSESVYRVSIEEQRENFERHTARIIHGDVVNQLFHEKSISGIDHIARLAPFRKAIVRRDQLVYYEDRSYACDNQFLEMFDIDMLLGDPANVLDGPYKVILAEHIAKKYFGDNDPVGQFLEIEHQFGVEGDKYEVTGVFKPLPLNTHFQADLLTSFEDPSTYNGTAWVYIMVRDNSSLEEISRSIDLMIKENNSEEYANGLTAKLTPLTSIHLKSHLAREVGINVHYHTLYILFIAGILVFILAWFNFTLLTISQNQLNINRLIYQWQMGSGKKSFFNQFMIDFLTIGLIAFVLSIFAGFLISRPLENMLNVSLVQDRNLLIFSLLIIIALLVLSAMLTSWFATNRLYRILKIKYFNKGIASRQPLHAKAWFVRSVIIIEFAITYVLLTNLMMIRHQVNYSINQQIGANDETTIQVPNLPRFVVDKYRTFKDVLLEYPVFTEITAMMEEPGGMAMDAFGYSTEGFPDTEDRLFVFPVDEDFVRFYDLEVLYGGDFPEIYNTEDTTEFFILNESAARLYDIENYSDLVGRELRINFSVEGYIYPGEIIGVMKDFHLSSMNMEIKPMVIFPEYTWLYCISLRFKGDPANAAQILETEWKAFFPKYPLEYMYTSDIYDELYSFELTELEILLIFSILSILIAGTGLFALSGFFLQGKMHAAAIRKINGASFRNILWPELLQYLFLAVISTAVAFPLSWISMRQWLSNFSYQVEIPYLLFPGIGICLIIISWLAVLYHAVRLSRTNPIESIRN